MSEKEVWIVGYGQFGRIAVEYLREEKGAATDLVVIDKDHPPDLPPGIRFFCSDGVEWLTDELRPESNVGKIIPALPVHLAAHWLNNRLTREGKDVKQHGIPDELLALLPHPSRLGSSSAISSHADFLCPPNCSEPDEICMYTRQKRPAPLYNILQSLSSREFTPLIVRSRQFAPGVGGYFPEDLWSLLDQARSLPGRPLLIGTSCKCHGILDAICFS